MKGSKVLVLLLVVLVVAAGIYYFNGDDAGNNPDNAADAGNADENKEEEVPVDPMNVLILGLDDRNGDYVGRTDTIMIAGFNPEHEAINLLSIPRDTRVKIKGAYDKINAAYVYGGPELAMETLEDFLQIEIDHYVVVNFDAFVQLVDMVGGIEVDVPIRMYYPKENIDLKPGKQILSGEEALGYARFRYTEEGDIGRAKRQQQVVELLLEKLFSLRTVVKLPEMVKTVYDNVKTDFSVSQLMEIAGAAQQVKKKPLDAFVLPGANKKLLADPEENLYLWYYVADEDKLEEISKLFQ